MDYFTKLFKYRAAKVREYWIVDPTKELVTVYRFEKETMEQYSFGEEVSVGIYNTPNALSSHTNWQITGFVKNQFSKEPR